MKKLLLGLSIFIAFFIVGCNGDEIEVTSTEVTTEHTNNEVPKIIPPTFESIKYSGYMIGGESSDIFNSIVIDDDGNYIIVGSTKSDNADITDKEGNSKDALIVKINQMGEIVFIKTFGSRWSDYYLSDVILNNDGNYVVTGTSKDDLGYLAILDKNGELLKETSIGGSHAVHFESVIENDSGEYVVAGGYGNNGVVTIYDKELNHISDANFGDTSTYEFFVDIIEDNNEYYLVGYSGSLSDGFDGYLVKITNDLNLVYEKHIGGASNVMFDSVIRDNNGYFVIVGNKYLNNQSYGYILKINNIGNIIAEKVIGGNDDDYFNDIVLNEQGNYMIVGTTYNKDGSYFNSSNGGQDTIFLEVNINLDVLYTKTIGGEELDLISNIVQDKEGNYLLVGYSSSPGNEILGYNNGHFDGWLLKISISKQATGLLPKEDITGIPYQKYEITFDTNSKNDIEPIKLTPNENIDLPTPVKEGYKFLGWYSDENLNDEFLDKHMSFNDICLYAKWGRKISFETNTISSLPDIYFTPGESISIDSIPTKEGYSFDNWYVNKSLTELFSLNSMPDENILLYAKWKINDYKINFETNGGINLSEIILEYEQLIEGIKTPEKKGNTFGGWYLDQRLENDFDYDVMPASDLILYAKWIPNEYTVTFELNGGEGIHTLTQAYDTTIDIELPKKNDFIFDGWYTNSELTDLYDSNKIPAYDIILYAKWVRYGGNIETAQTIYNYTTYIYFTISIPGEYRYFKFTPTNTDWYSFNKSQISGYENVIMERVDERGQVLSSNSYNDFYLLVYLTANTTYYFRFSLNDGSLGTYLLEFD